MVDSDGSDVFWRLWYKNSALLKRMNHLEKKLAPWQKMMVWEVNSLSLELHILSRNLSFRNIWSCLEVEVSWPINRKQMIYSSCYSPMVSIRQFEWQV